MLNKVKATLMAACADAQAADQHLRELMGLYSWGGAGRGTSGPSKVEIFQDPRSYNGLASKFEEWWTKVNAWLDCHPKQFSEKDPMGNNVPAFKPCMYMVLSRLKGSKGVHYAEMELKKLMDGKSLYCYWELSPLRSKGSSAHSSSRIGLGKC